MNRFFSQATIDFLVENRLRNDKAWFYEHKQAYQTHVVEPLQSLALELTPTLREIDEGLVTSAKPGGSVSRIWRDARFSKDKSLFRDVMWCMFVRQKGLGLPEFFFVISPEGFLYGCGYYSAGAASMDSVRSLILAGDDAFKAALGAYEGQRLFQLDGDLYKRSRHPDAPEHLKGWLDRKTICFTQKSGDFAQLYSDTLTQTVAQGYKTLAPMYHFLMKAEARVL